MVVLTQPHEGVMFGVPSILSAVVTVELFNRIGTFLQHLLQKRLRGVLGFVRQNGGVQISGEVINGYKEIFSTFQGFLPFQKGQSLGVPMEHLTGVILIVAFGLFL